MQQFAHQRNKQQSQAQHYYQQHQQQRCFKTTLRSSSSSPLTSRVQVARHFCNVTSLQRRRRGYYLPLLNLIISTSSLLLINNVTSNLNVSASGADYQGASIGKLNSYSNQVSGDVFVINDQTFLIKNFFYDGLAQDAFFWAGSTIRPSNKGFIVASEDGRTNKLQRYTNRDITIRLPNERRVSSIRWLAIWDVRSGKSLGDIIVPDEFEPPAAKKISEFSSLARNVRSQTVTLLDARSIGIEQLYYDGSAQSAFFLVGIGPQPNVASGIKVPDETGALEPLGAYTGESIILELPGNLTIFDIDWLAIYDTDEQETLGSVLIPSHLSVPPALVSVLRADSRLPQCEQLHRDVQLHWDVFGPQITFELIARIASNDYIAFGISGADNNSQMIGSDVAVSWLDGHLGFTVDYNLTDKHPCVALKNNEFRGACPDIKLTSGVDNYQIHTFNRENGLTKITFRRNLLNTGDEGDKIFKTTPGALTSIVWAVGRLNKFKEPRYHHMYSKGKVLIEFGRKLTKNCFQFAIQSIDAMANANDATLGKRQAAVLSASASQLQQDQQQASQAAARSPFNFLSRLSLSSSPSTFVSGGGGSGSAASQSSSSQMLAANSQQSSSSSSGLLETSTSDDGSWPLSAVLNRTASVFYARVGHPGVNKGYMHSHGDSSAGLVWYINGLMAPVLHVQRGRTYTFRVEGGDSADKSYRFYHPLYITDEPFGGYALQNTSARVAQKVFAGLQFERLIENKADAKASLESKSSQSTLNKPKLAQQVKLIGKPAPQSAGRLCAWLPASVNDVRKADLHESFAQFRAKLSYSCATNGEPGIVVFTPNVSTPDVVYYQSYSQRNMGGKIIVADESSDASDE